MKLDHVPVGITYKEKRCPIRQFNRLGNWNFQLSEVIFHCLPVVNLQRNMCESCVFDCTIRENVIF